MISKLSWPLVLCVCLAAAFCFSGSIVRPPELLDRGRGLVWSLWSFVLGHQLLFLPLALHCQSVAIGWVILFHWHFHDLSPWHTLAVLCSVQMAFRNSISSCSIRRRLICGGI